MVIDTSALIEVFIDGPEAGAVKTAMRGTRGNRFMSSASYVEAHIVIRRRFLAADRSRQLLDRMIGRYGIAIESLQESHARLAVDAYHKYGKGGGSGVLEFGDCFAYALAKQRNDSLLFIGNDFAQSDIHRAMT
jgi:ribonuclease VapC